MAESGWPLPCAHPHARAREKSFKNFAGFHNLMAYLAEVSAPSRASVGLTKWIGNDRFDTVLLEQIVQCLDRERLQGGVLVKRQLPERPQARSVHPDQKAAHVSLDPRLTALC
jgi:hypothetical protein